MPSATIPAPDPLRPAIPAKRRSGRQPHRRGQHEPAAQASLPSSGYIAKLERILLRRSSGRSPAGPSRHAHLHAVRRGDGRTAQAGDLPGAGGSASTPAKVKSGLDAFKARLERGGGREGRADRLGPHRDRHRRAAERLRQHSLPCLPWTGADYEQVVGRLTRLNGRYDSIEVHICRW